MSLPANAPLLAGLLLLCGEHGIAQQSQAASRRDAGATLPLEFKLAPVPGCRSKHVPVAVRFAPTQDYLVVVLRDVWRVPLLAEDLEPRAHLLWLSLDSGEVQYAASDEWPSVAPGPVSLHWSPEGDYLAFATPASVTMFHVGDRKSCKVVQEPRELPVGLGFVEGPFFVVGLGDPRTFSDVYDADCALKESGPTPKSGWKVHEQASCVGRAIHATDWRVIRIPIPCEQAGICILPLPIPRARYWVVSESGTNSEVARFKIEQFRIAALSHDCKYFALVSDERLRVHELPR